MLQDLGKSMGLCPPVETPVTLDEPDVLDGGYVVVGFVGDGWATDLSGWLALSLK